MFTQIMAPVDLAHVDRLKRAIEVTADLARHYDVEATYVAVTSPQPGEVAHSPEEYETKLGAFAEQQAEKHGYKASFKLVVSHDPAVDLDDALSEALEEIGADLVVMATHIPGLVDYVWPSHGGKLASHSSASVFLVRPQDD